MWPSSLRFTTLIMGRKAGFPGLSWGPLARLECGTSFFLVSLAKCHVAWGSLKCPLKACVCTPRSETPKIQVTARLTGSSDVDCPFNSNLNACCKSTGRGFVRQTDTHILCPENPSVSALKDDDFETVTALQQHFPSRCGPSFDSRESECFTLAASVLPSSALLHKQQLLS